MTARISVLLALAVLAVSGCSKDSTPGASFVGAHPSVLAGKGVPAGATAGALGGPAHAATAMRFAGLPDRGSLVEYPRERVVRREAAYTWHRADLSEAHARAAIGGTLSLRSPSGEFLRFDYERHVEHADGNWTWVGRLQNAHASTEAVITFGPKAAFGNIGQRFGEPLRLTLRDGVSWLVETDPRQIALLNNVGTRPTQPDFVVAPELVASAAQQQAAATGDDPSMSPSTTTNASTTVDLVLGYTPGFVTYYGGESAALTRLNNMVEITNESYVNSQINARVRLVKTLLVNYTDANANKTALEELTGYRSGTVITPNPAFTELRQARETFGGDLVSLVRRFNTPENEGCGIAWLLGGGRRGSISSSSEYFGYSIVSDGRDTGEDGKTYFCRDETLAHEIGHNLGSAHDRDTADGDDNILQTSEYGVFDFSFGYKTTSGAGNFYTVMAYGDSGQTRYRVFSNPRITFCGGLVCGIENQADNARSIGQTIGTIASFRATTVTEQPPASGRALRDVNLDGRSDIVWHNPNTGAIYAWFMNGATPSTSGTLGSLPVGGSAIALADFNADGRTDLLSVTSQDVRISLGQTSSFDAAVVISSRPPAGWNLAGTGDVNGDGRADVVWHNIHSGELYYWLISGTTIVGGQGAAYLPVGSVALAVADFDGDGRADVLSTTSQDTRVSLGQATGLFGAATVVGGRPSSAWNFAGAGDISGDGKADVVWHNLNSGELYYWVMGGAAITGGQGLAYLPLGSAALALADVNGDARADVVSTTATDVRISLAQSNGSLTAPVIAGTRPASGWRFVDNVERDRVPPKADANGDGRSDIVWARASSTTTSTLTWLMSGVTSSGSALSASLPVDAVPLAMADFNGDGRADLLSGNATDVWIADGDTVGGFGSHIRASSRPPTSWVLVGAGDSTGDGKADVIWHNVNTGELYTWVMSGAVITGGHGSVYAPIGARGVTVTDFNGDGRMDVLTISSTEVRVSLAVSSGGFGPSTFVSARPASGWNFAGAGDVNGDGKSDVIWHNANSGELYYWLMVSHTILGGQGGAFLPLGSTVLAATDYSGDGRADVASLSGNSVNISLMTPSGLFAAPVYLSSRPNSGTALFAPNP